MKFSLAASVAHCPLTSNLASGLYRPASRSRVKTATPPQGRYNPEAEETSSEVGTEDSNEGYQTETDSDDDRRFDNQDKRRDREREFSEGEEEVEPSTDEDTKNRGEYILHLLDLLVC